MKLKDFAPTIIFWLLLMTLVAVGLDAAHGADVQLAWDAPDTDIPITGYRVYYGTTEGEYPVEGCDVQETTCVVENLDECWTYHFVAVAYNENGESEHSNSVTHKVPGICGTSGTAVEPDQEFIEEGQKPTSETSSTEPVYDYEEEVEETIIDPPLRTYQPNVGGGGGGGCFIQTAR